MRYSYYPGCSAHSTAKQYDASTRAICSTLGIELNELSDWNCCGSSASAHTNAALSTALAARNLILAEAQNADLALTCAFCFNRLNRAAKEIAHESPIRSEVERIVGKPYTGKQRVRHLIDILLNDVGVEKLRARVTYPLSATKAVCYYGCLLARPRDAMAFDDPENPMALERIMESASVQCLPWSYKTECCGASLSITRSDIATKLVHNLFTRAKQAGAECIVTACPLCFSNLESRSNGQGLPVFYFTELLGAAFGVPDTKQWFSKHLIQVANVGNLSR